MEIRFREIVMLTSRKCYEVVCNHPFLVGIVCFLILLYRSCPFLFFFLFYASPVLVCTAVLLGTLLSFGPSTIPETDQIERVSDEITSLKAGIFGDASVITTREESFSVKRFTNEKRDFVDLDSELLNYVEIEASKVEPVNGLVECEPLMDVSTQEIEFENERTEEPVKREVNGLELEKKNEICGENLSVECALREEEISAENHHLGGQEVGTEILKFADDENSQVCVPTLEGDATGFSLKDDNRINDDADSFDSESDEEGSSSPDATMANIIPMLNELHLLLDSEDLHSTQISDDGSDASSEQSHKSDDEYEVSDEDSEIQGNEADKDDADVDEEEEEETLAGKDDESKSAIKWTEDDQKNLMDLGTSELERNQRLENLIARRRARNNWRMMAEKNLIDFSSADLPFNVPPITATRNNPFDMPDDSYNNMGFPPIPGSAPSILLPRRNPFDLPYDSNEEKPDLKEDSFQQEFVTFHQKDTFFRRHESFSLGHSFLGPSKLGQQENKWRLHFMPEKLDSEEATYPQYQTQLNVVNDTNLSSIPDIESISVIKGINIENDVKLVDQKDDQEMEDNSYSDHGSDMNYFRKGIPEDVNSLDLGEVDERDLHEDAVKIVQRDVEKNDEVESILSELEIAEIVMDRNADESQLERQNLEKNYSSNSSSSSSSETNEGTIDENGEDKLGILELRESQVEESNPLVEALCEESDIQLSREISDVNQQEPVYDSSPPAVTPEKFLSFSSTSSDTQVEFSNMCASPVSDETNEPFSASKSGIRSVSIQKDSSSSGDASSHSSEIHVVDKNEFESMEVLQFSDDKNELLVPECEIEHVSANSSSSSLESGSADRGILHKEQITDIKEGSPIVVISRDFPSEVNRAEVFSLTEEVVPNDIAYLDSKVISTGSSHEHLRDEDKYSKPAFIDGPLEQGTPDHLSLSSGSTSTSSVCAEYELETNWPTSREGALDEIEYEEQRNVSEQLDFLAEEYKSQFTENRIDVETDKKEETDEDLSSNFNIPENGNTKDDGNSSHVESITQGIEGGSPDSDSDSSAPKELIQMETNLDDEEVILLGKVESFVEEETKGLANSSSDLKIVAIQTLEESHVSPKENSEENADQVTKLSDLKNFEGNIKSLIEEEMEEPKNSNSDLKIVEVQTVEESSAASKENSEENADQLTKFSDLKNFEGKVESFVEEETKGPANLSSDLKMVAVQTLEECHVASKENSEENADQMTKLSDLKHFEGKVESFVEEEMKELANSSSDLKILKVQTVEESHDASNEKSEENADQLTNHSDLKN